MNSKEQILQMLKDGIIDVQEATKLLDALGSSSTSQGLTNANRMLRIKVDSQDGDVVRVNVPLSLIKAGINLSQQLNINGQHIDTKGIDFDLIMKAIDEGATGEIVSVDSADGDKVKVYVD